MAVPRDRPQTGGETMTKSTKDKRATRRRFLGVAAAGAAATVAAPTIVSAQGPISMRWQSTWPSKDIFHEYALDYANMLLAWHKYGGGKELLEKLYATIGANVVSFPYGPMPTQPFGWFKKPVTKADDVKGLKFRTVGISIDVYSGMGAAVNALPGGEIVAAMDRGLLDAAEFNNATSDRILGFADVSKVCMLQSFHQNAEQFEIMFNKTRYDALPEKMKAIISNAVDAAGQDMAWKAIDRYSKDYEELQTKDKVKFYKTPDSVLQKQLEIYDQVVEKKSAENPLFKEIVESQLAFAKRVTQWEQDTVVSRRMAYNHYFGPNAKKKT